MYIYIYIFIVSSCILTVVHHAPAMALSQQKRKKHLHWSSTEVRLLNHELGRIILSLHLSPKVTTAFWAIIEANFSFWTGGESTLKIWDCTPRDP